MIRHCVTCIVVGFAFGCSSHTQTPPETAARPAAEHPAPETTKPTLSPNTPAEKVVLTHVLTTDATYYLEGPQQARAPDGVLKSGTRVRLVQTNGSYCVVSTENGVTAHISTDGLKPL
jgi:hypothetical protein